MKVPLTGIGMPLELDGCNLSLMIVASPKLASGTILKRTYNEIVEQPEIIKVTSVSQGFPEKQSDLQGIKPPQIKIILKERSSECSSGIEVEARRDSGDGQWKVLK